MRLRLTNPRLFVKKVVGTFAAALVLLPLVELKSDLPVLAYLIGLVVLHAVIVALYVYRTQLRSLDPDARSLIARLLALVVVGYLLWVFSSVDPEASRGLLVQRVFLVSILHAIVLALLMTRVSYRSAAPEPAPGGLPAPPAGSPPRNAQEVTADR